MICIKCLAKTEACECEQLAAAGSTRIATYLGCPIGVGKEIVRKDRSNKGQCLDLNTASPSWVTFLGYNGWPYQVPLYMDIGLVPGELYWMTAFEIGNNSSKIALAEFPGKSFNHVCFDNPTRAELDQNRRPIPEPSTWEPFLISSDSRYL